MSASGYTRQSSSQISSGQPITSAPVNNEFNQLVSAFSGTAGHDHSGGTGLGPNLLSNGFGISTATAGILVSLGSAGTPAGQISPVTITGTSNQITITNGAGTAGNPTIAIATGYLGQSSITTLGTITTGVWNGTVIGSQYGGTGQNFSATTGIVSVSSGTFAAGVVSAAFGGTGINNGASTITVGGNLTFSGAFPTTINVTGSTTVTLPTGGTLINSAVTSLSSLTTASALATVGTITSGIWNAGQITTNADLTVNSNIIFVNGKTASVSAQISLLANGIPFGQAMFIAQNSDGTFSVFNQKTSTEVITIVQATNLVSLSNNLAVNGAITAGTWNGTAIGAAYGGTGVSNTNTITLGGNISTAGALTTSGAFGITLTATNTTSVTLPTSGTLVNTAVTALSSLATVGTITSGTWNATAIGSQYGGTGQNFSASTGIIQVSSGTMSASTALANGTTATTQSANNNSTKVATTAYVDGKAQSLVMTALGVGSIILALNSSGGTLAAGGTTAAANLVAESFTSGPVFNATGDTLTGIWQTLQHTANGQTSLWQRTA